MLNKRILTLVFVVAFLTLLVGCLPQPTNQVPVITSIPITAVDLGEDYTYDVNATDPDGDTLTYSLITKPTGMTITSTTGLIKWTPTKKGNYAVVVKVSDGDLDITQSFTIVVSEPSVPPVNQAPIIISTPIAVSTVGVTYFYNVNATDPDGDTLTYSLITYPTGMTIKSGTGLIMWTPTAEGDFAVVVNVSDGVLSDTQGFTIKVSKLPVELKLTEIKVSPDTMTLVKGGLQSFTVIAHYSDGSIADITYGFFTYQTTNWDIARVPYDRWVEAGETEGTATITVTYKGKTDTIAVTVSTLPPANQAPIIYSIPNLTAIVELVFTYEVEAFDPDVGDVLTYSLTDRPKGMTIESDTGLITWTPTSIQTGHNEVRVKVSDGDLSATKYFGIWVDQVKLIGIEVDPKVMDLIVGESKSITSVTAHYNNETTADIALDCTYTSDSGIAEVDFNGLIEAVAEGKATITVTYRPNGTTFRDTIKVTVSKPPAQCVGSYSYSWTTSIMDSTDFDFTVGMGWSGLFPWPPGVYFFFHPDEIPLGGYTEPIGGSWLFEDIDFSITSEGQTFSVTDGTDFEGFANLLTNGTDELIWLGYMGDSDNIANGGGGQKSVQESEVFSGTDVGTDFPGYIIKDISLTFGQIYLDSANANKLVLDFTIDIYAEPPTP